MKKLLKRSFAILMVLCLAVSAVCTSAFAAPGDAVPSIGVKSSERMESDENRYKVEIDVPGVDAKYDEVIVMVDGSYSMDEEWNDMKKALLSIGETVLNGSGNTKLTLMTFGMSPNVVTEHVESVAQLQAGLPQKPGGLLYGRSATNCHGAFLGLQSYIADVRQQAGDALNNVYVIFLSDGGVNMWSKLIDWNTYAMNINAGAAAAAHACELEMLAYTDVNKSAQSIAVFGDDLDTMVQLYKTATDGLIAFVNAGGNSKAVDTAGERVSMIKSLTTAKTTAEGKVAAAQSKLDTAKGELEALIAALPEGADPAQNAEVAAKTEEVATLTEAYNNAVSDLETVVVKLNGVVTYDTYTKAYGEYHNAPVEEGSSLTKAQRYVQLAWEAFYADTGMSKTVAQPIHVMETAFLKYQETLNNCYIEDCFYMTATTAPINGGKPANGVQAAAVAETLAGEVDALYMVRYGNDHRSGWMTDVEGTQFVQSTSISTLTTALSSILAELAKTPFNDVVVTDYMSKWVNLDAGTLQIVDNSTGNAIWTNVDGWLIDEGRPTAQEVPVLIEKVDPADYAAGGADVVGNTSGDIYKLTWHVKDGAMLRSDTYSLQYEVEVDTLEDGFEYDVDYPANGNTDLHYTDEDDNRKTDPIVVPEVYAPTVDIPDEEPPLTDLPDDLPPKSDVPKTGDVSLLWLGLSVLSGCGVALIGKKRED